MTIIIIIIIIIISFSFLQWQILYQFSPIKQVIGIDQRFMNSLSISYVFKNLYFPIILHFFSPVQFLEQFSSPSLFATFLSNPSQPRFQSVSCTRLFLFHHVLRTTHPHYHCTSHNHFCHQAETFFYQRQPVDLLI